MAKLATERMKKTERGTHRVTECAKESQKIEEVRNETNILSQREVSLFQVTEQVRMFIEVSKPMQSMLLNLSHFLVPLLYPRPAAPG